MTPLRVLILGGTGEALALSRALVGDHRFAATLSLAGRTTLPVLPPIGHRLGGFGGVTGMVAYLRTERIAALVDATHPFAAQISRHAQRAARESGIPLLALRRPAWEPKPGEHWTMVPDLGAGVAALGRVPQRVFLTIGRQELAPFRAAPWHFYVIRSVEPPDPAHLPPRAEIIAARGPFAEADERALLIEKGIEVLVTKNSGAQAVRGKLDAARGLGIAVVMVTRPILPDADHVAADAESARAWLLAHHAELTRRGV